MCLQLGDVPAQRGSDVRVPADHRGVGPARDVHEGALGVADSVPEHRRGALNWLASGSGRPLASGPCPGGPGRLSMSPGSVPGSRGQSRRSMAAWIIFRPVSGRSWQAARSRRFGAAAPAGAASVWRIRGRWRRRSRWCQSQEDPDLGGASAGSPAQAGVHLVCSGPDARGAALDRLRSCSGR